MHIFSVLEIWYWIINWWALPWERLFLPLSQLFLSCLEFLPRVEASLLLCGLVSSFFGPPIILNFLCLYKLLSPFSVAHMFMCLVLITWNWMTYHRAYVWENKSHTLSNQCPHIASHLGWGLVKFSPLLLDCQLLLSLLWFCLAFLKYIRIWRWSKWNCQIMGEITFITKESSYRNGLYLLKLLLNLSLKQLRLLPRLLVELQK